jgi:hypothetical protein
MNLSARALAAKLWCGPSRRTAAVLGQSDPLVVHVPAGGAHGLDSAAAPRGGGGEGNE